MNCDRCGTPLQANRCPHCSPHDATPDGVWPATPASSPDGGVPRIGLPGSNQPTGASPWNGQPSSTPPWSNHPADATPWDGRPIVTQPGDVARSRRPVLYAAGWTAVFGVLMFLSAYFVARIARSHHIETALNSPDYSAGPHPPPPYLLWLLLPGVVCWAACGAAEILLARRLGDDYPALGPLAWLPGSALPERMRHAMRGIDSRLGNAGGGCLAVAAFAVTGPLIVLTWSFFTSGAVVLWVVCLLAATAVHLLSARARLDTWRRRATRA